LHKSKPRYILPFFGIQFIDYLFPIPQILASIYTHPYHYDASKTSGKRMAGDELTGDQYGGNRHFEMRNPWANPAVSSETHLHTTSLLFMLLILLFKTYFLCVVWKCYRYLHMKEFILPLTLN